MKKKVCFFISILLFFLFVGCQHAADNTFNSQSDKDNPKDEEIEDTRGMEHVCNNDMIAKDKEEETKIDWDSIKPNEVGKIMIIMYHNISSEESTWSRHYSNFKKDLETLYKKNYRLISMKDFIDNNIDIPAGYTPVIITFDDGLKGQFSFMRKADGVNIHPNCAVKILEDFNEQHPDFGKKAIFYINSYPVAFGQPEFVREKLNYLVKNGMEIGNHTYSHKNLAKITPREIKEEIGKNIAMIKKNVPEYEVDSLALPYGEIPKNLNVVVEGSYREIKYRNKSILLVGAEPALPPNHVDFNPLKIPRIRGSERYLQKWLEYFDANPGERYVSDGDPNIVTVPQNLVSQINKHGLKGKVLRIYDNN